MQRVITFAQMNNWLVYHTYDSRRSQPGFVDLVLCKPGTEDRAGRLVLLELKSARGRLTVDQAEWLAALATVPGLTARLARPSDWAELEALFRRPDGTPVRGATA